MSISYQGSNILIPMHSRSIDHAKFADLQQALFNTFRASSQQQINEAQYGIECHQLQEGYVVYLLQIINHALSLPHGEDGEQLASCALAQLKNYLRMLDRKMSQADMQYLVGSLVVTNINICTMGNVRQQAGCMKLLKDVVEIISLEVIQIGGEIIATIEANLYSPQCVSVLPACLNIILGIINHTSLLLRVDFSEKAINIMEKLHPLLMNFTNWGEKHIHCLYEQLVNGNVSQEQYLQFKRKYEEILYLNIKLLHKTILFKKIESIEYIFFAWAPIIINRVAFIDPSFTSQGEHDLDMGLRGTDKFNYYHGKKWALKLLRKIMDKVLVYKTRSSPKAIKVMRFYQENLPRLMDLFRESWQHKWPQKIRLQLLRTMQRLLECQPLMLVKHFEEDLKHYQEVLLPPMIVFSNEADILIENPAEFLHREDVLGDKVVSQYQSCRLTAARVWLGIANIDFKYNPACEESKMLMDSVRQLEGYLHMDENLNMQARDAGCFLLTKLNQRLRQNTKCRQNLGVAVTRIINDNLQLSENGNFMILIRAFELLHAYDSLVDDRTKMAVQERIITIFRQFDLNSPISYDMTAVLHRGTKILTEIVNDQSQNGIHMNTDDAKMVITVLFTIVRSTSNEDFIELVNIFLRACMKYLGPCYKEIAIFLQGWFTRYAKKDMDLYRTVPVTEYKGNNQDIALGAISIYETILIHMDQNDAEIVKVMDDEVASIITYILQNDKQEQMMEKGMQLLSIYLQARNVQSVDFAIIKLCRLIVLRIAGLPEKWISKLQQANASNQESRKWIAMLLGCRCRLSQGFTNYVSIVRLFIRHMPFGEEVRGFREIKQCILSKTTNNTEYLIYLAHSYFSSAEPSQFSETYNGKCFSLLSLLHYYEHHQRKQCTTRIHPSVNQFVFNLMLQVTREYIVKRGFAKYNAQMFCLWIHEVHESFVNYTQGISMEQLSQLFTNVLIFQKHFGLQQLYQYEQAVRCTFGLSSFIRLGLKFNDLWSLLPIELWMTIIAASIRFCYKSTEAYADEDKEDSLAINSDDECGNNDEEECQEEEATSPSEEGEPDIREHPRITQIVEAPERINRRQQQGGQEEDEGSDGWYSDCEQEEDCLDYQETDDRMGASPLEQQDDTLYLLQTLYTLNHTNRSLYQHIITSKRLQVKIDAIIYSADCHIQPDRRHFYELSRDHWQK